MRKGFRLLPGIHFGLTRHGLCAALCRFVTSKELREALAAVPEITSLVGQQAIDAFLGSEDQEAKAALKELYSKVARASDESVKEAVGSLVARLQASRDEGKELTKKEELVLRLNTDYPLDIGILSVFFLNLLELEPGEAIYLDANEPHAYLTGELMEVMATSDNVVRAGLTPKLRDVEVLLGMLTYNQVQSNAPRVDEAHLPHVW